MGLYRPLVFFISKNHYKISKNWKKIQNSNACNGFCNAGSLRINMNLRDSMNMTGEGFKEAK